ncbi:Extracellular superoxide dismutase [Cu-Zn] [Oryzias melastigma]|uniref:Superoxide dismutase [Cu-Zn] n=1 Tax=Oryzias melastigma TaxID=30732 RepID=A0A3B3BV38_ORYME|nr:extracellular superoxide dismutase [Cu-Zn] [Oryzias melastigma]KAF6733489.1 Extracellular superoxide dismutase [Cu-Zn] [Oryzias melastigma]
MRAHRSVSVLKVALLVWLACSQQCSSTYTDFLPPEFSQHNGTLYAACKVRPSAPLADDLPNVSGQVLFKQDQAEGKLQVLLQLSGFPTNEPSQPRAVHIHQYGDLSQGCTSTGGHYNPYGVHHPNHPGDFGNFVANAGRISDRIESEATLFGGLSVLGRAVVVHETVDDLGQGGDAGSLMHGNAGRRLACCVIGMCSSNLWDEELNTRRK